MEIIMVCKVLFLGGAPLEGAVLVGHHPVSVFTTTDEHLGRLKQKPNGHYDREDLLALVKQGHAVLYDEKAVRVIVAATHTLIFGCPPVA
jgi:hypothetical protein